MFCRKFWRWARALGPWLLGLSPSVMVWESCIFSEERSQILVSTYCISNTALALLYTYFTWKQAYFIYLFHLYTYFIETTMLLKYLLLSPFCRRGNFPRKDKELTWSRSLARKGQSGLSPAPMTPSSTVPSRECFPQSGVSSLPFPPDKWGWQCQGPQGP